MTRIISLLFKEAESADKIEAVKAYVKTIRLIMEHDKLVSVRLFPPEGRDYNLIQVIKEVRTVFRCDLKEAKDLVEAGHTWEGLEFGFGNDLMNRLKKVGATVSLIEQGASK